MPSISVSLPDHIDVMARINLARNQTPDQLDTVLQEASAILERELKTEILQTTHGTGLTAASIETRRENTLTYGIGSYTRGDILRFLDRGTGIYGSRGSPFLIEPRTKRALHWISQEFGEVFAAYCVVMGIVPRNFMERSVQTHLSDIDQLMNEEVKI